MQPLSPHDSGEIDKVREETGAVLQQAQAIARRGAYFWVIMVLTAVVGPAVAITVSVVNTQESIHRERAAREAAEHARQAAEKALCGIYVLLDDAYHQKPPPSETGKAVARAISNARKAANCPPRAN